jgi:hypothetical protein
VSRLCAVAAVLVALSTGTAVAAPYTAVPGPYRANARFLVSYRGIGFYSTVFHAHPPNPGGADDTNDARDSSAQAWALGFRRRLALPPCGPPAGGGSDPCAGLTELRGAIGATTATGEVRHVHVDGLYPVLDRTVTCRLQSRTTARTAVDAAIGMRYLPGSRSVGVTAYDPVASVLMAFPAQCAGQGDSLDRILDFYATPGFSFASGYGADRWYTSAEVAVPAFVLHRSTKITIPLRDTPAGRPPRGCAVFDPSFEGCTTGGSWSGVLTLSAPAPKQ